MDSSVRLCNEHTGNHLDHKLGYQWNCSLTNGEISQHGLHGRRTQQGAPEGVALGGVPYGGACGLALQPCGAQRAVQARVHHHLQDGWHATAQGTLQNKWSVSTCKR